MKRAYLGIDMGSVSTKGVIIDENNNIIASSYFYNEDDVILNLKKIIKELKDKVDLNNYKVVGIGTTGSKRKIIGTILEAGVIKNEISSHVEGTINLYPDVKTIIEMGGEEIKIINIRNQKIVHYEVNNLYNLGVKSLTSNSKDDLNKIKNIFENKILEEPIVFQGGASQNNEIVKTFKEGIGKPIIVNSNAHLMGALGVAILSKKEEKNFSFDLEDFSFNVKVEECSFCFNNCDIIKVFRDNKIIDIWGGKCPKNELIHKY